MVRHEEPPKKYSTIINPELPHNDPYETYLEKKNAILQKIELIKSQKRLLIEEMNDCINRGLLGKRKEILDKLIELDREEEELLISIGLEVNVHTCIGCGEEEGERRMVFSAALGGWLCPVCKPKVEPVPPIPREPIVKPVSPLSTNGVLGNQPESVPKEPESPQEEGMPEPYPVRVEPHDTPIKSLNWNAVIIIFFGIILSSFIISSFLDNSGSQDSVTPSNSNNNTTEKITNPIPAPKDIFDKINEYREQNKKYKILWSDDAYRLTDFRASDMVKRNYFSHTTPDGKTVSDYIGKYNFYSDSAWGENLCKGCSDPIQTWIGSADDKKVLLGGWGKGAVACESDICVFIGVNE